MMTILLTCAASVVTRKTSALASLLILLTIGLVRCSAQQTKKITVNGLSLTYIERGSGPLVILIHGSVSDYREWENQIGPLAPTHIRRGRPRRDASTN